MNGRMNELPVTLQLQSEELTAFGSGEASTPHSTSKIIESFRLEKNLKIIKSNHQPNITKSTTKSCS